MWARRLAAPAALLGLPLVIASLLRTPAAQQAHEPPVMPLPQAPEAQQAQEANAPPPQLPIVVNTWASCFSEATAAAYRALEAGGSVVDAVEQVWCMLAS